MIISVIIPCRNEVNFIEECINAIYSNKFPDRYELSVVIVDGMSDDGTREKIKEFIHKYPNLYLVDNELQLTPFAFNLGIKYKNADFYQIVGVRQILDSNYLIKCISIFKNKSEVWCVGGLVKNVYVNKTGEIISKAMSTSFGMGLGNFRTILTSTYTDTIGTPMYPSWVFEKIGYFDEELIRNQDDDFNFRVLQAGGKIWFESEISIKYYVRSNYNGLYKQFYQYGYWKVFVNKKHSAVTTFRQLVPPLFVLYFFILPIVLISNFILGILFSVGLLFYILLASFFAFKKSIGIKEFFGIFKTFPILHFSYGLGYLQGIIHFIILGKNPSNKQKKLSR